MLNFKYSTNFKQTPILNWELNILARFRSLYFMKTSIVQAEKPCLMYSWVPMHETWAAMEELQKAGTVKHLGVCNFKCANLFDLMACASKVEHQPEVLQIERHVYLQEPRLLRMANEVFPMAISIILGLFCEKFVLMPLFVYTIKSCIQCTHLVFHHFLMNNP